MTTTTLPDLEQTFDLNAQAFLETDFHCLAEGVSEALTMANHTVLASRDPLRPNTHWSVSILYHGAVTAYESPLTDDLTLSLHRAISAIRAPAIQDAQAASIRQGFVNLE